MVNDFDKHGKLLRDLQKEIDCEEKQRKKLLGDIMGTGSEVVAEMRLQQIIVVVEMKEHHENKKKVCYLRSSQVTVANTKS